jgi:parallel beta-helix repeat protein
MLTLAFSIQPVKAPSMTIIVPDDYTTIQEAINNANDGDTIFVRNGTYYEHVVVNKTVSLIGENRETAIIDGNGTGKVVHIVVDNVNITQFTIRNSRSDYPDGGGIYLSDSRNCNISFNILTSNYVGIWLWGSSHNYLMNNIAFNNSCGAIELRGSVDNILVDNNMSRNLRGINMPSSSNNLIINNTATYNTWDGIHVYSYSSYNVFVGNDLSNNDFSGIDLDSYSSNNNLTGNTIYNNSEEGIRIGLRCMFNALTDNSIMDGKKGIHLYDWANNNTLISNTVSSNQYGIWFDSWPSSNNTIFHNNFVNNSNQVYIKEQINNIWDDGYPSGGNYWSDYNGSDLFLGENQDQLGSDGIGDTHYIIDENNTDRYPLMNPWTPTIKATVDFEPDTLNLRSKGKLVTCYIELPDGNDVANINVSTIKLNGTVSAELKPTAIGDYDNDAIPDLMVKFDRTKVMEYILNSVSMTGKFVTVTLAITGKLNDGTPFQGTDTIRIIN